MTWKMQPFVGARSYVGIGEQTEWGKLVLPTAYFRFQEESFDFAQEIIESGVLIDDRMALEDMGGALGPGEGDFRFPVRSGSEFGYAMKLVSGQVSSAPLTLATRLKSTPVLPEMQLDSQLTGRAKLAVSITGGSENTGTVTIIGKNENQQHISETLEFTAADEKITARIFTFVEKIMTSGLADEATPPNIEIKTIAYQHIFEPAVEIPEAGISAEIRADRILKILKNAKLGRIEITCEIDDMMRATPTLYSTDLIIPIRKTPNALSAGTTEIFLQNLQIDDYEDPLNGFLAGARIQIVEKDWSKREIAVISTIDMEAKKITLTTGLTQEFSAESYIYRAPSIVTYGGEKDLFAYWQGELLIRGETPLRVSSSSITIDNQIITDDKTWGDRFLQSLPEGQLLVTGTGTMALEERTLQEYEFYRKEAIGNIKWSFKGKRLDANHYKKIEIECPYIKWTGSPAPKVSGSEILRADFEFKAYQDEVTGRKPYKITLINFDSGY
jgi:hypothetical protein